MMMVKRGTKWPGFQTGIQGPSVGVLVQWCRNVGHVTFDTPIYHCHGFLKLCSMESVCKYGGLGGSVSH